MSQASSVRWKRALVAVAVVSVATMASVGAAEAARCRGNCTRAVPLPPPPLVLVPTDAVYQVGFTIGQASLQSYGSRGGGLAAPIGWIEAYRLLVDAGVSTKFYSRPVLWDCWDADCEEHDDYIFTDHKFADFDGEEFQAESDRGQLGGFGIRIVMNDASGLEMRVSLTGTETPVGRTLRGPDGKPTVMVLSRQPDPFPVVPLTLPTPSDAKQLAVFESHSPQLAWAFGGPESGISPQAWFDFYRALFTEGLAAKTYTQVTLLVIPDPNHVAEEGEDPEFASFSFGEYKMGTDGRFMNQLGQEFVVPASPDGNLPGLLLELDALQPDRIAYGVDLFGTDIADFGGGEGGPSVEGLPVSMVILRTKVQAGGRTFPGLPVRATTHLRELTRVSGILSR